jgi:hypothetical protein
MADDRYRWLDGEAAERLLRGLPVDARSLRGANEAVSGHPHTGGGRTRPFERPPQSDELGRRRESRAEPGQPDGAQEPESLDAPEPQHGGGERPGAAAARGDEPSARSSTEPSSAPGGAKRPEWAERQEQSVRPEQPGHAGESGEPRRPEQAGKPRGSGGAHVPVWADGEGASRTARRAGRHESADPGPFPRQHSGDAHGNARETGARMPDEARYGGDHQRQLFDAGGQSEDRRRPAAWETVPPECHPAERLAAVLDALVAEHTAVPYASAGAGEGPSEHPAGAPESAELPGEAAAVSAFRAAHPEAHAHGEGAVQIAGLPTDTGTVVGRRSVRGAPGVDAGGAAGGAGGGSGPHGGRNGPGDWGGSRPGTARRASVGGRPLRAGFVMAVAGCALGGVAVAAGAGVLPSPFDGGPAPSTSVSPSVSRGGDQNAAQGGQNATQGDAGTPDRDTLSRSPSGSSAGDQGGDGQDRRGASQGADGRGEGHEGEHGHISEAEKRAVARSLCKGYEEDELSSGERRKLEQAAGGPEAVHSFCQEHGGADKGADKGSGGDGGSGGQDSTGSSGASGSSGSGGNPPPSSGGSGDSGGDSGGEGSASGADSGGQGSDGGSGGDTGAGGGQGATATPSASSTSSTSSDSGSGSDSPADTDSAQGTQTESGATGSK